MNYFVLRNKGVLQSLILNTLDRKPVIDQEARNHYRDLMYEYIEFLHRLSFLEIDPLNQKLGKHKSLLNKLETLAQRYNSIGNEAIPETGVDKFLTEIQSYTREWIDNDWLEKEILQAETRWFSNASNKLEMNAPSPGLERKKSEAFEAILEAKRPKVNF